MYTVYDYWAMGGGEWLEVKHAHTSDAFCMHGHDVHVDLLLWWNICKKNATEADMADETSKTRFVMIMHSEFDLTRLAPSIIIIS